MLRSPFRSLSLAAVAGMLCGVASAGSNDTPARSTEEVRVQKVIVRRGDSPDTATQSYTVKTREVDGQAPTTQVTVMGEAGDEVFEVGSLEPGESRSFTTAAGKALEIRRLESGLSLSIDGRAIEIPGDVVAGTPGDLPGDPHEVRVIRVVRAGGEDGEDVIVDHDGPVVAMASHLAEVDFDELETLKGLEPEVREKVVAALREILSSQKHVKVIVTSDVVGPETGAGTEPLVKAPRAPIAR